MKKKTSGNGFLQFLSSLDSIYVKLCVIAGIFWGGFRCGCYYQETQSIRTNTDKEKILVDENFQLKESIISLKEKNSLMTIQIEKLKQERDNYEKRETD